MKRNCKNCGYCCLPKEMNFYKTYDETNITIKGRLLAKCNLLDFIFTKLEDESGDENDIFMRDCPYFSTLEDILEEESFREEIQFEEATAEHNVDWDIHQQWKAYEQEDNS